MKYAEIISAVFKVIGGIILWFRRKAIRREAKLEERVETKDAVIEKQKEVIHELETVKRSDDAVRDWVDRHPGKLPDRDPNRRD